MKKRFYIIILNETDSEALQTAVDEELKSLQDEENEIIDVDVKPDYPYGYLGIIKYSFKT